MVKNFLIRRYKKRYLECYWYFISERKNRRARKRRNWVDCKLHKIRLRNGKIIKNCKKR